MYYKMTAEYRAKQRWFPVGSMALNHPDGLGVAYISQMPKPDQWQVVGYRGTAGKPSFNFSFRSRELAEKKVTEFFEGLTAHKQFVAKTREEQNKPNQLKVGQIIYNSWGYDQTNVDFYQIVEASQHFVWIRPIASEQVLDSGVGPMSGHVVAIPDRFTGEREKHKASGTYVTFKFGSGSLWDGKEKYNSWYA
jgi:hypothetical protein